MKTYIVAPYGYCNGVRAAIDFALEIHKSNPFDEITILGMLVHNQITVDELQKYNIKSVFSDEKSPSQLLEDVHSKHLIFTAHGHDHKLDKICQNKQINYYDAICPIVKNIEDNIAMLIKNNDIIYIGKKGHPESDAIKANFPKIHVIYDVSDIDYLNIDENKSYYVINQSTLAKKSLKNYYSKLKSKIPNLKVKTTSCPFAVRRQENILNVPHDVQLIYVVGDPHSNNTQVLVDLASKKLKIKCIKINDVNDIKKEDIESLNYVAVASGTSTPTSTVEEVIHYLQKF